MGFGREGFVFSILARRFGSDGNGRTSMAKLLEQVEVVYYIVFSDCNAFYYSFRAQCSQTLRLLMLKEARVDSRALLQSKSTVLRYINDMVSTTTDNFTSILMTIHYNRA
jgi:hypothetical protein